MHYPAFHHTHQAGLIWVQVLHDLAAEPCNRPSPTYVVCGPKKSGKSTFARMLCNVLLQHHPAVALLEADCGQPQFGPAGLVSVTTVRAPLLLPPPLLLQQPHDSILIGDTSPQNNPLTYLNAIRKLHQLHLGRADQGAPPPPLPALEPARPCFQPRTPHAHQPVPARPRSHSCACMSARTHMDQTAGVAAVVSLCLGDRPAAAGLRSACNHGPDLRARAGEAAIPLVVNTMGWVKGFGLSLLRDVVLSVQPQHVVVLQSGNPVRDLPAGTDWFGEGALPGPCAHVSVVSQRGMHAACRSMCPWMPSMDAHMM